MITSKKIECGFYKDILPQLYRLKEIKQKNNWHDDNVFDHTVEVVRCLEINSIKYTQLSDLIGSNSRRDILLLSGALHDIGKLTTSKFEESKISFPDHENVGADMIPDLIKPFQLSKREEKILENLIRYHCEIHEYIKDPDWILKVTMLGKKVPLLEMNLLGLADTKASILSKTKPIDYSLRIKRYEYFIDFMNILYLSG